MCHFWCLGKERASIYFWACLAIASLGPHVPQLTEVVCSYMAPRSPFSQHSGLNPLPECHACFQISQGPIDVLSCIVHQPHQLPVSLMPWFENISLVVFLFPVERVAGLGAYPISLATSKFWAPFLRALSLSQGGLNSRAES